MKKFIAVALVLTFTAVSAWAKPPHPPAHGKKKGVSNQTPHNPHKPGPASGSQSAPAPNHGSNHGNN